ncbi:hypothetical protein JI750_12285 [Flavobacterium sp. GN10]|uniref:DUF4178 domain-containing protein n=1 Tax=Flavobacterium tagetis TaxID=2801336 RepID=A0ABS1KEA1_9FLAO|nr:hypothetical protein [Flavobacterium tagetis]MBL0737675.1 hypothetical protein [Flavobacterium tagetis]
MNELKLTSFLGIEFGSSKEISREKLLSREGAILDEVNSSEDALFFDGLKFGGRQTSYVLLLFVNNKFTKSSVVITPKLDAFTINLYKEIKSEINSKYYKTEDDFEIFEEPYYEDDGYTETGIRVGKISFESYWKFTDQNGGKDDFIALRITEDMQIIINYEDGDLSDEMADKKNIKNSEDY